MAGLEPHFQAHSNPLLSDNTTVGHLQGRVSGDDNPQKESQSFEVTQRLTVMRSDQCMLRCAGTRNRRAAEGIGWFLSATSRRTHLGPMGLVSLYSDETVRWTRSADPSAPRPTWLAVAQCNARETHTHAQLTSVYCQVIQHGGMAQLKRDPFGFQRR